MADQLERDGGARRYVLHYAPITCSPEERLLPMSTEVSEASVEEVSGALHRNFASFGSQQWIDTATALMKSGGQHAAAQLAPGETVEWVTPGIVHRNGKLWPGGVLVVTPHRLVVCASRGSIRTKREVSSLYRGPESLIGLSHRLLPGTSADHWTLEIATQQGPFLFAFPPLVHAQQLAQITAEFVTGRARYTPQSGIVINGVPWGNTEASQPGTAAGADAASENPFEAAKVDLVQATTPASEGFPWPGSEAAHTEEPGPQQLWTPTSDQVAVEQPTTVPEVPEQRFWSPSLESSEVTGEPTHREPAPLSAEDQYHPGAGASESSEQSTGETASILPEADWYPDPLDEANLRYWDGQRWTHNTAN